ncbi:phage tail assembly chaperone [Enterovirga rhinocerotis]|uniref:Uncharacterized protein n=1 Tax=Enterovirga rhinocerotis TaxID=1339210 RepID=A0A4R7BWM6_9HYPH|nr:hypothetical protein [Enterovirga rhinocerotis]TDR90290.1 hypothetical protein EV668_3136 [Enterovirga rhinocerotis]
MAWGSKIEVFELWAAEGDNDTPLAKRPELPDHLHFAWSSFWALQGDRHLGFGSVGPIPFQALDAYARRCGIIDIDEFDRLHRLIGAMDKVWLDDARRRQEAEARRQRKPS